MNNRVVGLRDLIRSRRGSSPAGTVPGQVRPASVPDALPLAGDDDLEVVGESHYQEELWTLVGGRRDERVRVGVVAELHAEPDNPNDQNAISVWIRGLRVGYLSREDARAYRPGLLALQQRHGRPVALAGVVVGGGDRNGHLGMLGVWLSHDPADFGLARPDSGPTSVATGQLRTGLTEAMLTDAEDDSYDLSWLEGLPADPLAAIRELRVLLVQDPDLIDRHFMYGELEELLYKSRDTFTSALAEYDDACAAHDREMDAIRSALLAKFGTVPLLDTYRQMAIRQQKAKNWDQAARWVRRGLDLYGDQAARPEAVDDLRKRLAGYEAKLMPRTKVSTPPRPREATPAVERLLCESCGAEFERAVVRGRKPKTCPSCR